MSEYTEPQYCFLCHEPTSLCQCERTITDLDEYIDHLRETITSLSSEGKIMRKALVYIDDVAVTLDDAEHAARQALSDLVSEEQK